MGTGGSQEASFDLVAPVPAGTWHVVADGIVIQPVDVRFDLLRRRGADDAVLASWTHHFEPKGGGDFSATAYEVDQAAPRLDYAPGDALVFRFTGTGATAASAYIPNGDGARTQGRIPRLELP